MADAALVLHGITIAILLLVIALLAWGMRLGKEEAKRPNTVMGHAEELRRRIIVAVSFLAIGMLVAFSFSLRILPSGIPVLRPDVRENIASQLFVLVQQHLVPAGVELVVTRPMDGFLAQLGLSIAFGAMFALPVLLWQIFAFVSPALDRNEKRVLWSSLLPAVLLFLAGVLFCWFIVLAFLLETLYGYSTALEATPLLTVNELIRFTVTMLLVFGISFQTPLVMYVLARTGVASSKGYLMYWRHAVVGIMIFAAFVTDPTIISQIMVALPLIVLYFAGIGASKLGEKKAAPV